MIYKVKEGGSIMSPDGSMVFKPGMQVPVGGKHGLTQKMINEHLRAGYLRAVAGKAPEMARDDVPGVEKDKPVIPMESDGERALKPEGADEGMPDKPEPVKLSSKWAMDPDVLEQMNLEQLNVMVLERDESVPLFETKEEAVGWLSQDYEPPAMEG